MSQHSERLALFLPSLAGGGAERMMLNLVGGCLAAGVPVDLVCASATGPYRALVPAGACLIDLGAGRVLAALPGLASYLRRERPAALLAAMDHANLVALWARGLARVPTRVVVSVRNQLSLEARHAPTRLGRLLPTLARQFYPGADGIVAVSQGVADDLRGLIGAGPAVTVIPNPVVTDDLPALAAADLDHPWFAPGEPPVVLAAGRLTGQKDLPTLLRAFARLVPERDLRLVILGDGPDREALTRLSDGLDLGGRVALPGFAENPFAWMARARVFVLSSAWEGLPGVLIQALACGTPVVSTDCPSGPREVLADGRFGPLVPVGDDAALARAIAGVLDNPPAADFLKARADDYRLEPVTRRYLAALGLGGAR